MDTRPVDYLTGAELPEVEFRDLIVGDDASYNRDPHLPPPAVVDWLLEQNWSEMIPITSIQYEGVRPHGISKSKLWEYQMAGPELGEDYGGHILLPVEALDVLRKDRDARQSALEQKRQACEADELAIKAKRWSIRIRASGRQS
jgi:hypothetical protein